MQERVGKRALSRFSAVAAWAVVAFAVLGLSYCEELPKYRFERAARDEPKGLPGVRLIGTTSTSDIMSPMSLIRPVKTIWRYAVPYPTITNYFYLMVLRYDHRGAPDVFLVDADCADDTALLSSLDGQGAPVLDLFGRPIRANDGRAFRRLGEAQKLTAEEHVAFCQWNWGKERSAVAKRMLGQ